MPDMYIKIYEHESAKDMADKIFQNFQVHQSATIIGWFEDGIPKGKIVWDYIITYDKMYNYQGKFRRKKILPNSNGVPVAHKIFRWQQVFVDKQPKWTIWRVQ